MHSRQLRPLHTKSVFFVTHCAQRVKLSLVILSFRTSPFNSADSIIQVSDDEEEDKTEPREGPPVERSTGGNVSGAADSPQNHPHCLTTPFCLNI